MNMACGLGLRIAKPEGIPDYGADQVAPLNRATRVTAEHPGASLDKGETGIGADDANRCGGADLEGGAVQSHEKILRS